jgi:diacylglycerol kinase (ATP)
MRGRLIANPVAGTDQAPALLATIAGRLRPRAGDLDVVLTAGPGDAGRAAADAGRQRMDYLFVAGGDGTLNEALNGLATVPGALARTTLAIVPLGTGNDFASALGFPDDPGEALEVLVRGVPRAVDLGRVNGRLFINASAGGFIADVSEAIDPALKSLTGRLAFLIGGARVLLSTEPFRCDAGGRARECLMFAACNAPTIGGGRPIAPHADPADGQLDVCLVSAMELLEFLAMLRRVAAGSHLDDPRVEYFRASRLTLRFDRKINVNADGEPFAATRCDYDVLPGAVKVLAPA